MPKKAKSKHCWSPDIKQHTKCKFGMCQCPCHQVNADKNIGTTNSDRKTEQGALLPCPFCGGPAEQRITNGPKRGFIGCFSCMIGTPFNVPYGEAEREAWNARAQRQPPLCAVHQRLDDADALECEIGNDCVACSLNERRDLLALLAPLAAEGNIEDSVTVLRRVVEFYKIPDNGRRVHKECV